MTERRIKNPLDFIKKELEAVSQEFTQVRLGPFAGRLHLTKDLQETGFLDPRTNLIIQSITMTQTKILYSYLEREDQANLLRYCIAPRL